MIPINDSLGRRKTAVRLLLTLPAFALLGACDAVVLDPSGYVAAQQRDLLVISVILMLVIIVPVMALTVLFAWRYRHTNEEATYEPDWDHSTQLELLIWAAPLLIIICLGAITWLGTHTLDPYRPIDRIDATRTLDIADKPLEVDVVAMDWKWLFIYPEYGIATVNELAAPVDRPIQFKITASDVMNSFYIPALAGQIYAMPGMETKLHAVINKRGAYHGFSANYSGAGFSGMDFRFLGLSNDEFGKWIAKAKASGGSLDRATYLKLEKPSENVPVKRYASIGDGMYWAILNMCVDPGSACMDDMMRRDAATARGEEPGKGHGAAMHGAMHDMQAHGATPNTNSATPASREASLTGAGLSVGDQASPPRQTADARAVTQTQPL